MRLKMLQFVVILTLCTPIFAQDVPIEVGWNQIRVFRTNRAEVEKKFGPAAKADDGRVFYTIPSVGKLVIVYSTGPCRRATFGRGEYNLVEGAVIQYNVYLDKPYVIESLNWRKERYEQSREPHIPDMVHYYNAMDGVWITTRLENGIEKVQGFWFLSTDDQKDKKSCGENRKFT